MATSYIPQSLREQVRRRAGYRCEYFQTPEWLSASNVGMIILPGTAMGTQIIGLTPCGRATVETLKLNHPLITVARSVWVSAGLHPPKLRLESR